MLVAETWRAEEEIRVPVGISFKLKARHVDEISGCGLLLHRDCIVLLDPASLEDHLSCGTLYEPK